jgi:predicted nucleic acid-binding protein
MQKPQLVAVDTNVLMRLADGHEATIDAWHMLKRRIRPVQFVALPTVMDELASKLSEDSEPTVRAAVEKALRELRSRWHFQPADFNAAQDAIAANALQRLRDSGLLPYEERNDCSIVAEAAVLNCVLLVSRDSHLTGVDHEKLAFLFRQLDLPAPIIATPENLLKKFYPK